MSFLDKEIYFRYGRDYYINDARYQAIKKRPSRSPLSSKSSSVDREDVKVSSLPSNLILKHFTNPTFSTDDHKDFLLKRFLNSEDMHSISGDNNFDEKCFSNDRKSSDSSWSKEETQNNFNVSKENLMQLEEQMLHNNIKRDSFRARSTATRNFVLNPLFEEKSHDSSNHMHQHTNINSKSSNKRDHQSIKDSDKKFDKFSSNKFDTNLMLEASKANCVENVFVDLIKVRRASSLRDSDFAVEPGFVKKRCNSFRCLD